MWTVLHHVGPNLLGLWLTQCGLHGSRNTPPPSFHRLSSTFPPPPFLDPSHRLPAAALQVEDKNEHHAARIISTALVNAKQTTPNGRRLPPSAHQPFLVLLSRFSLRAQAAWLLYGMVNSYFK